MSKSQSPFRFLKLNKQQIRLISLVVILLGLTITCSIYWKRQEALTNKISTAIQKGQFSDVASTLEEQYDRNPNNPEIALNYAKSEYNSFHYENALQVVERALPAKDFSAEAYLLEGSIYRDQGESSESTQVRKEKLELAEKSFLQALERDHAFIKGYVALVDLYLSQENRAEAVKVVNVGIERTQNSELKRLLTLIQ
jgi:tetratricopeptide (TPR) repeat protein